MLKTVILAGAVYGAAAVAPCNNADAATAMMTLNPCGEAADKAACATNAMANLAVAESCKKCLVASGGDLNKALNCAKDSDAATGGDTDTSGGDSTNPVVPVMPDTGMNEMLAKACKVLPEIKKCMDPLVSLAKDPACSDEGTMIAEAMGGTFDTSMEDPFAEVAAFCANPSALGRRLLGDMESPDFSKAALDGVCKPNSCMPQLFKVLKEMVPCVKPIVKDVIASLPAAQQAVVGPMIQKELDFGPIADKAEKTLRMACTKNSKGQYCMRQMEIIGAQVDTIETAGGDMTEMCPVVADLGCCVGTIRRFLDEEDPDEGIEMAKEIKGTCGWEKLPTSCSAAGETRQVASVSFKIGGVPKATWDKLSDKQKQKIALAIQKDVARALGCDPSDVELGAVATESGDKLKITATVSPKSGKTVDDTTKEFNDATLETTSTVEALTAEDSSLDAGAVEVAEQTAEASEDAGISEDVKKTTESGAAAMAPMILGTGFITLLATLY